MKKVLLACIALAMVMAGTASAAEMEKQQGPYVKAALAYSTPADPEIGGVDVSLDDGYGGAIGVGYKYDAFRVEGEFGTYKFDVDNLGVNDLNAQVSVGSGDVRYTTYMVNGYYDYDLKNDFGVYGMGGIGYGETKLSLYNVDGAENGFVWKVGLGGYYKMTEEVTLDFGWEYLNLDEVDVEGVSTKDLKTHNFLVAVRYQF